VASVRRFYPQVPIRLLVGGPLQRGLAKELAAAWNVGIADLSSRNYGWGFVKLEPLFGPSGERFLVLDSDTVMAGPVLELAGRSDADLIVDGEAYREDRGREIYFDWVLSAQEGRPFERPEFLFNTGQWFGRSGVLRREDFEDLVDWTNALPVLKHPRIFKNGEQGVLNYVVNRLHREGRLTVDRAPLLCWPGDGMQGISAETIAAGTAPARVVHWAGMKGPWHGRLTGGDVLMYFEQRHYERVRGPGRRQLASCRHAAAHLAHALQVRVRLGLDKTVAAGG
jgi:hypothetical protein